MAARRKRKKSEPNRALRKKLFLLALGCFILASALFTLRMLLRDIVFFPVKQIEVVGNRHLSDNEIANLSKVKKGRSMLSVRSREVVERLRRSPWIKDVSLRKELPNRIIIRIREAVPTALFRRKDGLYLIDGGGDFLERISTEERFLPVIKGNENDHTAMLEAIEFAGMLKRNDMPDIDQVEIVLGRLEEMTVNYGTTVIKVGYGNYEEKLQRYMELRDEISRRAIPVEYIDLRYDNRLVVKTVEGGTR